MIFNSFDFLVFFPLVCILYYIIPYKVRYIFLLFASYFFYMCWNPKYAVLLLISTLITYLSGSGLQYIENSTEILKKTKWKKNSCCIFVM